MTTESHSAADRHPICDECETVAWCAANGCIPVEEYDARNLGTQAAIVAYIFRALAVFDRFLSALASFITTPTFGWKDVGLSIAAVLILAAAVLGPLYWGVLQ